MRLSLNVFIDIFFVLPHIPILIETRSHFKWFQITPEKDPHEI